eukprot:TRINITY_DN22222_c0_g1_i1.p1 TRINITY_DN22222_c0_g1~~TRINITY_DN22222_c0_g1_i1.p1  ORF type:complete len:374 (-),score=141.01 TRINITY_DN22222_c0_g1_i1:52-1173(-)
MDIDAGMTDDLDSHMKYVATKTERLIFCWPIKGFSERTTSANTQSYHFMEENLVNMVQWRMEVSPCDKDVQGTDVISAKLFLTYSGTNTARDFKVNITLSLKDSHGGESHRHTSCVYYLTREGPPDGANPSYKVDMISREELLAHHLTLLPENTLTLVAKMVFVQEEVVIEGDQTISHDFLDATNSLSCDLSDAFKSTDFTDMTIICDKREFHCHKFMLAARSEVFAAMLRHEFLEKQNSRVDVKEIDGETMELLLSHIYTGHVADFKNVSVVDLFKAADRYRLDHLKHMCEEELVNRVEASNAADILSLAHKYNAAPLKSFALAMISRNVEEVMRTRGWKELILSDQGLLVEAFDSLARYNMELKNKIIKNP